MANRVLIGGEDPKTSLAKAAEAEQAIIDRAKR
jgi:multiple sugar transport system substrate-binding protein